MGQWEPGVECSEGGPGSVPALTLGQRLWSLLSARSRSCVSGPEFKSRFASDYGDALPHLAISVC